MQRHFHLCLCGIEFSCVINILPLPGGGRVRCEKWPESGVCESCLESMLANQSEIEQRLILQSMKEIPDALLAWQAEERINSLKATLDE
jgi:hypothetical protein